jgi:hypothetical protein
MNISRKSLKPYPRFRPVFGAGLICLTLTGCSLQGSASVAAKTTANTVPTSASATASGSAAGDGSASASSGSSASSSPAHATSSPASHTTAKAGPAACTAKQLRTAAGGSDAGAGHVYLAVKFTNISATACTLSGYPGVAGLDAAGHQIVQATRDTTSKVVSVSLKPGKSATATIRAANVPSGNATSCPPSYVAVVVTPPNTKVSTKLTNSILPSCGGLQVNAVSLT